MNGGSNDCVENKENDLRMRDELDIAAAYAQASAIEPPSTDRWDEAASDERPPMRYASRTPSSPVPRGFGGALLSLQSAVQQMTARLGRSTVQPAMSTSSGTGGGFTTRGGGRTGSFPPAGGGNVPPTGGGPSRPERPSRGSPPQRPANYQPEERYWTDYLRIALPVVGLLLMLGLFLFWVEELIGDETDPTNTPDVALVQETNVPATETPTTEPEVTLQASSAAPAATNAPGQAAQASREGQAVTTEPTATATAGAADTEQDAAEPTATTAPEEGEQDDPAAADTGGLAIGATASITEDDVRLRPEASTAGTEIMLLSAGTTVTILDGPTDAEGYTWWQVELEDGTVGWVAADFLAPA